MAIIYFKTYKMNPKRNHNITNAIVVFSIWVIAIVVFHYIVNNQNLIYHDKLTR